MQGDDDWIGPWEGGAAGPGQVTKAEFVLMLRKRGIRDRRVLAAMERVPRELFVGSAGRRTAYADRALPIDCGQTISQPYIVAFMTEQLAVEAENIVLEVGTGSGYQTAVLANLALHVFSLDRYRTLVEAADARLKSLKLDNVTLAAGDGFLGWPEEAPFDRIMVTAAYPEVPETLLRQLAIGGRLIMPVGPDGGVQTLTLVERTTEGLFETALLEVRFVPLVPGMARAL
ncbi:MAG: protein-L-isoaspartate(D-aspartate) O-methyltransferase [Hyphomicrobiales bacterium]